MNRSRLPVLPWLACVLAAAVSQPAQGWCDLVFQDVAAFADVVVLAEIRAPKGGMLELMVVEVFKGAGVAGSLTLDPAAFSPDAQPGERVVLALTQEHTLVQGNQGLGVCSAISVLPIHGGKLRARDRQDYDSRSRSMSLERLRRELTSDLRSSPGTRVTAR